jgi:hypothetical protein
MGAFRESQVYLRGFQWCDKVATAENHVWPDGDSIPDMGPLCLHSSDLQ